MAKKKPKTALYFTTIAVLQDDFAVLGGHLQIEGDDPSMTRFSVISGGKSFSLYDFEDVVYAIERKPAPSGKPRDTLCIIGRLGKYREVVSGEKPVDTQLDLDGFGYLLDLRIAGKHLFTAGTQNMVLRQDGTKWSRVDQGTFKPIGERVDRAFNALDGFSESDLYGAGLGGAIWHYDGKKWKKLDSPTNYDFNAVLCASSGDVYAGVNGEFVWKGDAKKGWTNIGEKEVSDETIWDMVEFQGKVYMAADDKLLVSDGGPVAEVKVPLPGEKCFLALDANARQLWATGDEDVYQFDGKKWVRHVFSENV